MFGRKREPHLLRINKKSNLMGRFFQIIQSNQFQNMGLILQWVQCAIPQENEKKGKELSEKSVEFRRSFSSNPSSHRQNLHIGVSLFTCPCTCPFPYAPSRSRPAATPSLSTRLISMWGKQCPTHPKSARISFNLCRRLARHHLFSMSSLSRSLCLFSARPLGFFSLSLHIIVFVFLRNCGFAHPVCVDAS